jgi:two-component system CheB/CheR fusion protein
MKKQLTAKKLEINKTKNRASTRKKNTLFPIAAIGASAGGLEAVKSLLEALPSDTGMAFVYIQHLDPNHESMLHEILARHTKMKVLEAKHKLPIKSDHFYIIPPNKDMTVIDGVLTLKPREARPSVHMPIDKFFISLAEKQKHSAIGIVLSGNANDGTLGLKAIKVAGGFTFVQDESAKFQSMPKTAIAEGVVDMVLNPKQIAQELTRISTNKDFFSKEFSEEDLSTEVDEDDFQGIIELLRKVTGVDFTHYKVNTIQRRMVRRMVLMKFHNLKDYLKYLRLHTGEVRLLYQDMLINVTSFFRDPDALEYIKKTILPKILKAKKSNEAIRIWIPACSTGEEAYSLAMIFHEILDDQITNVHIQIFATDLSETAITKARIGLYSKTDIEGISTKRLQHFFTRADHGYRIIKNIRDLCVFAPHNIFRDPPFSKLDLISCCNLMIYLDVSLQKKILHTFNYSLNPLGYLVLGKSETISSAGELFNQLERKYKVYIRKKDVISKPRFELNFPIPERESKKSEKVIKSSKPSMPKSNQLEKTLDDILLQKYVPACVVVNEDLEILQFRGSTALFLELASGKASLNLLKMARAGLGFELRTLIHKSDKSNKQIKKSGIEIKLKGHIHTVSIDVMPLRSSVEEKLFLIVFEETFMGSLHEAKASVSRDKIIKQLEQEIESLKEDMRSVMEDQEAHVEELQSANEEIVSSNEELQSINEELETSKEELESTNEELSTINNELQLSNEQLSESQEYSDAIFSTIVEAVIVLDKNFRIRSVNKAFYKIFNANEKETLGMLIFEIGNRQWDIPRLRRLLEEIINKNETFSGFEVNHTFPAIGHKIMLLNGCSIRHEVSNEQLILIAIEDITEHRNAEKLLLEREAWFRNMANQAPVLMWVGGTDKSKNFFNETWLNFTGRKLSEEKGFEWRNQIYPEDVEQYMNCFNENFNKRLPFQCEYRLRRADGAYRWILDVAKPTYYHDGKFSGYIGCCTEIHDKKLLHEELEQRVAQRTEDLLKLNQELHRSNSELQQFAYVASHDLQEPLRKILTFTDRLQRLPEDTQISKAAGFINKIKDSSQRMRSLIVELLKYSKSSRSDNKFVKNDLQKIIINVISDFELIIQQKNANIEVRNILPVIDGIPVQLEQLMHNMVSNALKFSRPGVNPLIIITCASPDKDELKRHGLDETGLYIHLQFHDNGIGFDPQYSEQIFDIFQRLNYKEDYPGTGIGLALCRKIVNNHNGKIFAESQENSGSVFHIILPAIQSRCD